MHIGPITFSGKVPPTLVDGRSGLPQRYPLFDTVQFSGLYRKKPISEEKFLKKFNKLRPPFWDVYIQRGDIPLDFRVNNNNETLLMAALRDQKCETPMALLKLGASVHVQDDAGVTPLMRAAGYFGDKNQQVLQAVLDQRPDISLRDAQGQNPMFYVIQGYGSSSREARLAIDRLQAAGLDINEPDKQGKTVLMQAIELGCDHLIIPLLERGADPEARDQAGQSAKDYALRYPKASRSQSMVYRLEGWEKEVSKRQPGVKQTPDKEAGGPVNLNRVLDYLSLSPEQREQAFVELCRRLGEEPQFWERLEEVLQEVRGKNEPSAEDFKPL